MKRIRYIPGAISLVLLLPLCLAYMYDHDVWQEEHCITVTFPIPKDQREQYPVDLSPTPSEARHQWIQFLCNGVDDETEATLLAFRDTLREIESRGDTTHGIHIRFGPDTRYATIIKAIDICRTTVRAWELNDHDLWTMHIPEPKLRPENGPAQFSLDCGTILTGCVIITDPTISQTVMTAFGLAWTGFIKPYWLSWLLFALIAALGIRGLAP